MSHSGTQTFQFEDLGASLPGLQQLNSFAPTHDSSTRHTTWQPCGTKTNLFSKNEGHTGTLYPWVKGDRYNPWLRRSLPLHCKLSANQTAGLAQWDLFFLSAMSGGCYKKKRGMQVN